MAKPQRPGYRGPDNDERARRQAYEQCKRRGHEESSQHYSVSGGDGHWWYRCQWCGILFRWGEKPLLEQDIPPEMRSVSDLVAGP